MLCRVPVIYLLIQSVIQGEDYPGVLPYSRSRVLFVFEDGELPPEERTVRGTLVRGLTASDVALLDVFESDVRMHSFTLHPGR